MKAIALWISMVVVGLALVACDRAGDDGALEVTQSWSARPVGPVPGSSMTSPLWVAR